MNRSLGYIIIGLLFITACNTKQVDNKTAEDDGRYFSIADYAMDQVDTYYGQPYGIEKITYQDGKTDTLHTNIEKIDWAAVLRIFFATDISDKKYLDKYNFSEFADTLSNTNNYYYEAKEKDLFTQKLHITTNPRNNRITSVYIETLSNKSMNKRTQRLYYIPATSIIIQEFEAGKTGDEKEVRVEYKFM